MGNLIACGGNIEFLKGLYNCFDVIIKLLDSGWVWVQPTFGKIVLLSVGQSVSYVYTNAGVWYDTIQANEAPYIGYRNEAGSASFTIVNNNTLVLTGTKRGVSLMRSIPHSLAPGDRDAREIDLANALMIVIVL